MNIPIATHLPFVIEERENEVGLDFAFKQSKRTHKTFLEKDVSGNFFGTTRIYFTNAL
jgi:hypothetical protein